MVLLGNLSPLDDTNPDNIKIKELLKMISNDVEKVIIATNANTKGEFTAHYLKELFKDYKVKITRIAYGLPMGSDIEFVDEVTLGNALERRREI